MEKLALQPYIKAPIGLRLKDVSSPDARPVVVSGQLPFNLAARSAAKVLF